MEEIVIYPNYYADFSCIGSACEFTCCAGWSITIDKKTYTKYRNIRDKDFAEELPGKIRRVRGEKASNTMYAEFVMGDNKICPFLSGENLCTIQGRFGAGYLSHTCRCYPRKVNVLKTGVNEYSLTMSCPEAVRIALFNKEPMAFTQMSLNDMPKDLKGNRFLFASKEDIAKKIAGNYAWDIRSTCIDIMQARRYSIAERIFLIGMMLNALTDGDIANNPQAIPPILSRYSSLSKSETFAGTLASFAENDGARLEMEQHLLTCLFFQRPIAFHSILNTLASEYTLTDLGKKLDFLQIARASLDRVKKWEPVHWAKWLEENSHVLENYFVNYIFSEVFPFRFIKDGLSLYQHFILLVEQYSIIRLLMCSVPEDMSHYPEKFIVEVMYATSRSEQHTDSSKKMVDGYSEKGYDNLAFMSFLLRS